MTGKKTVAYFVNWGIYGRNYQPQDIPASHLTHILYSFANVRPESGEVYLSDTYSDLEKHYPTDSWNDVGTNVYGCVGPTPPTLRRQQLRPLAGPHSPGLHFSSSGTWGLTVSILIGMPFHATQAQNFVSLLAECRAQLDAYGNQYASGQKLLLTIAAPCGATHYTKLPIGQMNQYIDFWNLMAYDFAGSWDTNAGHQANLYHSTANPASTPFNANDAVNAYIAGGVPCNKLILGMPLYGRSFQATTGPGTCFTGIGGGSWENGVWDYKALPKVGANENADSGTVSSWSYDAAAREMISYDTPTVAQAKSSYILAKGLGGGMWWELSSDKPIGEPRSLIKTTVDSFGGTGSLETTSNILAYPGSKYDNLRNQFGSE
ncbi:Glycoside Hydrolase Family 18 protein [Tuber magnatum]|uniref:chitinase n=1 Tax=Tuber magnatum TaxID=42249 RepID=A0A317T1R1_9PEZI|nr:Glycoside Hydrolase Family 18 protein [Tuber magnatum]